MNEMEAINHMPKPEPSIRLRGVTKIYARTEQRGDTLKESLLTSIARKMRHDLVVALDEIELEVAPGEAFGLIGPNGSGKSTLLKIVAGITTPTRGEALVNDRVLGLIELGAGFHSDLSGVENIRMQGAIYGLGARQIEERIDSILAFAELADFRDVPVRHYSSGMFVRLGFAIAIHCEPSILLIDEVLSVGDQSFQERCLREILRLRNRGVTLLFVTHYPEQAERVCDRIAWLEAGCIRRLGTASQVLAEYRDDLLVRQFAQSKGPLNERQIAVGLPGRFGSGEARIEAMRILDKQGRSRTRFRRGEPLDIEIDYAAQSEVEAVDCTIPLSTEDGTFVTHWWAEREVGLSRPMDGRGQIRIRVPALPLLPGHYELTVALSPPGRPYEHYDVLYKLFHLHIEAEEDWDTVAPILLQPTQAQNE